MCSGCHARIDAFGFALEGFDAIGRRRERDLGDRPIDTRAKAMDGAEFDGIDGLRDYLLTKRRRCVPEAVLPQAARLFARPRRAAFGRTAAQPRCGRNSRRMIIASVPPSRPLCAAGNSARFAGRRWPMKSDSRRGKGRGLSMNRKHRTSNFQVLWRAVGIRSAFDVGMFACWMFDVFASGWFRVPMHAQKRKEALDEPERGWPQQFPGRRRL